MKKMSLKDYSSFLIKEETNGEQQSDEIQKEESQADKTKKSIIYNNKEAPADERSSLITFLAFDIVDAFLKGENRTLLMKARTKEQGESQKDLSGSAGTTQKAGQGISPALVIKTNRLASTQAYIKELNKDTIHNNVKYRLVPFLKDVGVACKFLEDQNIESIMLEQQEKKRVLKFFRVRYTKFVDVLFQRNMTQVLDRKNNLRIDVLIKLIDKYFDKFTKEADESEEDKSSRESNEKKAQIFSSFFSKYKERHVRRSKAKTSEAKLKSYWNSTFGSQRKYSQILMAINTNSLDFPEFIVNGLKYKKLDTGVYSSQIKDVVLIGLFHELFGKSISKENLDKIFQIASKAQGTDNKESAKEEIKKILFGEGLTATGEEVAEVSQAEAEEKIESQPINTQMALVISQDKKDVDDAQQEEVDDDVTGDDLKAAKKAIKVLHDHITKTQSNYNSDKLDAPKQDTAYESDVFKRMAAVIASSMSITNLFLDKDAQSIEELLRTEKDLSKIGANLSILTHPDRLTLEEGTVGHAITEEMQKLNSSIKSFFEANFSNKTLLEYLDFDTEENKFKVKKDSVIRVFKELISNHKDKKLNKKLAEEMLKEAEASFNSELGRREDELKDKILKSRYSQAESGDEDNGIPKIKQVVFFETNNKNICFSIDNLDDGDHISLSYWEYILDDKLWRFKSRQNKKNKYSNAKEILLKVDGNKELKTTSDIVENILKDAANDSSKEEGQKIARKIADELKIDISKSEKEVSSESQSNKVQYIKAINIPDPLYFGRDNSVAVALAADMFLMLASSTEKMSSAKSVLLSKTSGELVEPSEIQEALQQACNIEVGEDDSAQSKDFLSFCENAFTKIGTSGNLSLRFLIEDAQITNFPLKKDALKSIFNALAGKNDIVKISEDGKFQTFNVERARLALVAKEIITSQSSTNDLTTSQDEEEAQETGLTSVEFADSNGDGQSNLNKGVNQLTSSQLQQLLSDIGNLQTRAVNNEFENDNDALIKSLMSIFKSYLADIKDAEEVIENPEEIQISDSGDQKKFIDNIIDEVENDVQEQEEVDTKLILDKTPLDLVKDKSQEERVIIDGAILASICASSIIDNKDSKIIEKIKKSGKTAYKKLMMSINGVLGLKKNNGGNESTNRTLPNSNYFTKCTEYNQKTFNFYNNKKFLIEYASYNSETETTIFDQTGFLSAVESLVNKYRNKEEVKFSELYQDADSLLLGNSITADSDEEELDPMTGQVLSPENVERSEEFETESNEILGELIKIPLNNELLTSGVLVARNQELALKNQNDLKMSYEDWLLSENVSQINSSRFLDQVIKKVVSKEDFDKYTADKITGDMFHEMVGTRVSESKSFDAKFLTAAIRKVANENELKRLLEEATNSGKTKLQFKFIDMLIKDLIVKATLDAIGLNKITGSITEGFISNMLKKATDSKTFKGAKLSSGVGGFVLVLGGLLGGAPIVGAVGSVAMGVFAGMSIMKRFSNNLEFKEEYENFVDDPIGYISKNFIQDKKYQNRVIKPIINNLIAYQATICVFEDFKGNADIESIMSGKDKSFEKAKAKFNNLPDDDKKKVREKFDNAFSLLRDCPWHASSHNGDYSRVISQANMNTLFNELFFGEKPLPEAISKKIISNESLNDQETSEFLKKALEIIKDKTSINLTIIEYINEAIKIHCGIGTKLPQSIGDFFSRKNRAKFLQKDNQQSYNFFGNILTSTQKGIDSILGTKMGQDKEDKSFWGNQEIQRGNEEKVYDALLLRSISGCNSQEEYDEKYQSKRVAERRNLNKDYLKNKKSLSYLLFEADSEEIKQSQDVEIVVAPGSDDISLAFTEIVFKPSMKGIQYLFSTLSGLLDAQAAQSGDPTEKITQTVTKTTETITTSSFYESLDAAQSVLASGKDAVHRVLELPNGDKMIIYFSNKSGDIADKLSFIIQRDGNEFWEMGGRAAEMKDLRWAAKFDIDMKATLAEGKIVLLDDATSFDCTNAMDAIKNAAVNIHGTIKRKIMVTIEKMTSSSDATSSSEIEPSSGMSGSNSEIGTAQGDFAGGTSPGASVQRFSGKMSNEQADAVMDDLVNGPGELHEKLLQNGQSVIDPNKTLDIEPAPSYSPPESPEALSKVIKTKVMAPDSTAGLNLKTNTTTTTTTKTDDIDGSDDFSDDKTSIAPTKVPDWLSTAKQYALYAGITNAIHSAYSRGNFKVIRGGIFGKVFFEKYSPSKIIAVDVLDALNGSAPTSTRDSKDANRRINIISDDHIDTDGSMLPGTRLGLTTGPAEVNRLEHDVSSVTALPMLEDENYNPSTVLANKSGEMTSSNESYIHNISLKDFMFENKVVIKNKRKW